MLGWDGTSPPDPRYLGTENVIVDIPSTNERASIARTLGSGDDAMSSLPLILESEEWPLPSLDPRVLSPNVRPASQHPEHNVYRRRDWARSSVNRSLVGHWENAEGREVWREASTTLLDEEDVRLESTVSGLPALQHVVSRLKALMSEAFSSLGQRISRVTMNRSDLTNSPRPVPRSTSSICSNRHCVLGNESVVGFHV